MDDSLMGVVVFIGLIASLTITAFRWSFEGRPKIRYLALLTLVIGVAAHKYGSGDMTVAASLMIIAALLPDTRGFFPKQKQEEEIEKAE